MKKWISRTIDGVLIAFIVFLVGCQVSIVVTGQKDYGVPSLFGYSFMNVLTDSMVGDNPDSLPTGTGVIMQKVDVSSIKPEDIVTFYSVNLSSKLSNPVVSHRVMEMKIYPTISGGEGQFALRKQEEYSLDNGLTFTHSDESLMSFKSGTRILYRNIVSAKDETKPGDSMSYTIPNFDEDKVGEHIFDVCGDNLNAQTCPSNACSETYRDSVEEKYYIGKVVSHSDSFGAFLRVVQSSWFIPVAVLVPLTIVALLSVIDAVKAYRKEQKDEEEKIKAALVASGIDPNDEKAVYLFSEKERCKIELAKQIQDTKDKEKKKMLKEMKKQKKVEEKQHEE
jgi:hypothetical protein